MAYGSTRTDVNLVWNIVSVRGRQCQGNCQSLFKDNLGLNHKDSCSFCANLEASGKSEKGGGSSFQVTA